MRRSRTFFGLFAASSFQLTGIGHLLLPASRALLPAEFVANLLRHKVCRLLVSDGGSRPINFRISQQTAINFAVFCFQLLVFSLPLEVCISSTLLA